MNNDVFSKKHTSIAKGLAMILMLFDHLFWLENGKYISLVPVKISGETVEWAIGSIGNICVAMFLVLSGYGMYHVVKSKEEYTFKDSLVRVKNIWINYAIITVLFVILDLIFGNIEFDFVRILLNIFLLDFSYNNYAWFMITYVVIIIVFPLCYKFLKKIKWPCQILFIIVIKVAITLLNKVIAHFIVVPEVAYKTFIEPFMFLSIFLIGYICAQYNIFEKAYEKIYKGRMEKTKLIISLIAIFMFMYSFEYTILDNVTAPIICFLIAYLCSDNIVGKLLDYIGKHSTNMWLVHYHIMILLLNCIVYWPKLSILILVWLIIILLPISYFIKYICNKIIR